MNKKLIGHNQPPLQLEDFYILDADGESTGRIKFTNTILNKYLKRKYKAETDKYYETIINDSEKIGLKAKINPGKSKSLFYQYLTKGAKHPVKYHLGNYPEMKVDAARSLVEDLKQAIKLGRDPKTVIEERRKAKTLSAAIALWKEKILHKATRYKQSTIEDIENRFKNWIDLNSVHPRTNRVILNNRSDLSIGNKKMIEITKDDLIAYHAAVSKSGKYQANRIIDDLKVIFKWAVEQKILKESICKFTKDELNTEYTRLDDVDPYSRHEWRLIRKAVVKLCKKNSRMFLACMAVLLTLYHGRRYKSELLTLKWTQIDWDMNKVLLNDTKTGKSQFSLNRLSRWVLRQLWKYKKERFKNVKSIKSRYLLGFAMYLLAFLFTKKNFILFHMSKRFFN